MIELACIILTLVWLLIGGYLVGEVKKAQKKKTIIKTFVICHMVSLGFMVVVVLVYHAIKWGITL